MGIEHIDRRTLLSLEEFYLRFFPLVRYVTGCCTQDILKKALYYL